MDRVAGIAVMLALTSSSTAVDPRIMGPAVTPLAHFGQRIGANYDNDPSQSDDARIHFPHSSQITYQQREVVRNTDNYDTSAPTAASNVYNQASDKKASIPTLSSSYTIEQQLGNSKKPPEYPQNVQSIQFRHNIASQRGQYIQQGQRSDFLQIGQAEQSKRSESIDGMTPIMPSNTANAQAPVSQRRNLISTSVTGLGISIMKAIDSENDGNLVVSPFSIALVLALLQQGAESEAQQQINRALRLSPIQAREQFNELIIALQNRRSCNVLNIATSIFVGQEFMISPQYKQFAVQYFSSNIESANFRNSELAAQQINDWVSTTTAGNIPYLVSSDVFTDSTQIILANAVYFKGLWNTTFHPQRTVNRPFNLVGGISKSTTFMHNSGKFQGGHDQRLDADWLVMPFEDLQYSLITIVPSVTTGVSSLLQLLRTEDILGYLRSPRHDVIISIPKFKVRIDTNLIRPLNALGVQDIFTARSGLSALGTSQGERPRVTGAVHAAVLSIDERGGSAAAATVLAVSTLSLDAYEDEFRFKADRPFVAMLWDNQLGVPLFVAKIADPTIVN